MSLFTKNMWQKKRRVACWCTKPSARFGPRNRNPAADLKQAVLLLARFRLYHGHTKARLRILDGYSDPAGLFLPLRPTVANIRNLAAAA